MRGLPTRPGPEAVDNALAGLDDSRWNRGLIRPPWAREWLGAGVGLVILGGMGLGAWTAAWKGIEAGDAPWIAGAALWGVGCASFLLQVSILGTRWLRFRGVALRLDPFPASPGGPLGGSVEIPQSPVLPRPHHVHACGDGGRLDAPPRTLGRGGPPARRTLADRSTAPLVHVRPSARPAL